jgi:hypothetical protein
MQHRSISRSTARKTAIVSWGGPYANYIRSPEELLRKSPVLGDKVGSADPSVLKRAPMRQSIQIQVPRKFAGP